MIASVQNITHPHAKFSLHEAIRFVTEHQKAFFKPAPTSLEDMRSIVREMASNAGVWETGMIILDLLDAAIDGVDLTTKSRMV